MNRVARRDEQTCLASMERGRVCLDGDGLCMKLHHCFFAMFWRHRQYTQQRHLNGFQPCSSTLNITSKIRSARRSEQPVLRNVCQHCARAGSNETEEISQNVSLVVSSARSAQIPCAITEREALTMMTGVRGCERYKLLWLTVYSP